METNVQYLNIDFGSLWLISAVALEVESIGIQRSTNTVRQLMVSVSISHYDFIIIASKLKSIKCYVNYHDELQLQKFYGVIRRELAVATMSLTLHSSAG